MKAFSGIRSKDFQWQRAPLAQDAFNGKKVAVIGGTNGIGRALALALVKRGAEVLVVGRTLRDHGVPGLRFKHADLRQMKDARRVATELPAETLDMLVFTTGIMAGKQRQTSPEGIELDMAVSYLNRFVMVRELADRLGRDRRDTRIKPRVFVWGFPGTDQKGNLDDFNSDHSYGLMAAHSNTVIGNEALVLDGATRYPAVNFYGINPGLMRSTIRSGPLGAGSLGLRLIELLIGALFPSVEHYSENTLSLLLTPDIEHHSGALFNRHGDPIQPSASLARGSNLRKVIDASEKLSGKALA